MLYALVEKNQIKKYPVTLRELQVLHPGVSFPMPLDAETLREFNVVEVLAVTSPEPDYRTVPSEKHPVLLNGKWTQVWELVSRPPEEVAKFIDEAREAAYRAESDPIYFKSQRGEATKQDWLDKIAEIKARYPKEGE